MLLTAASIDVLCRVPSAPGKSETPLPGSLPVFPRRLEGAHRQPLPNKRGLSAHRVHFGRFVLCPPHARRRWPGGMSQSASIQEIGRMGRYYPGEGSSNRLQALHAVKVFTLLGGLWTPYSQGRADGDDETSTESQEPRVHSMELLVQPDKGCATPSRSVSGGQQSTSRGPEWVG